MLQTMPNSQGNSISFRVCSVDESASFVSPLSLLFKVEVSYAPRALNKDILKKKLTNMLPTMPNNKKTYLVRRLKMTIGLAFKLSNRT